MKIFEKINVGNLEFKNRIIFLPVHTGFSPEKELKFLEKIAKGGTSAVTWVCGVSEKGTPKNMMLISDANLHHLKKYASICKENNVKSIVQLFHSGRNVKRINLISKDERAPIAPSKIASPIYKEVPFEMSEEDFRECKSDYIKAGELCKEAGIEVIEINITAGYLMSEFLSKFTNKRTDKYGGSAKKRRRFIIEIVRDLRKVLGDEIVIWPRVSAGDMIGGYDISDVVKLLKELKPYINAVSVTGGWHESKVPQISSDAKEGVFVPLGEKIRKETGLITIIANRINDIDFAEKILENYDIDIIGMAREFIVCPDFIKRYKNDESYKKCIACNFCLKKILHDEEIECKINLCNFT